MGLTASKTRSSAVATSTPRDASSSARSASSVRPVSLLAATMALESQPGASASRTRCAPSSSTRRPLGSGRAASARKSATRGLWRLEMARMTLRVSGGTQLPRSKAA